MSTIYRTRVCVGLAAGPDARCQIRVVSAVHEQQETYFYRSIKDRHQHIERKLEAREWRDDLHEVVGSGRAWRRERSGEEVVDGCASRVAHCGGLLRRQRRLVVGYSLHHGWNM